MVWPGGGGGTPPSTWPNFAYIDGRSERYVKALAHEIKNFLPPRGEILVVGLGNDRITADALGPAVLRRILVTRHIPIERDERELLRLRGVSAFCPGIEGKTGLSAGQTVRSIVRGHPPGAVLCIDSLFTSTPEHLGCTVQITDTGLCPGGEDAAGLTPRCWGCRPSAWGCRP